MRLALAISSAIALLPPVFTARRVLELMGAQYIGYALRLSALAALVFSVLAKHAYEMLNTQEADLMFFIYQKTYERSIRFVPVISFLTISVVALYTLAPIVVLLLLLPITRYSARSSYTSRVPFFSDPIKALSEGLKSLFALILVTTFTPLSHALMTRSEEFVERYRPVYELTTMMIHKAPVMLHDAFVRFSPLATLIAALIALLARSSGLKRGIALVAGAMAFFKFVPERWFSLSLTAFVFLVAMYERSSMNLGYSLVLPNVGSFSWIVPLGFTIVMTFVGGTIEKYLNFTLIPMTFISILTLLSLALGLILMRYLLKLPLISGMKVGVLRL